VSAPHPATGLGHGVPKSAPEILLLLIGKWRHAQNRDTLTKKLTVNRLRDEAWTMKLGSAHRGKIGSSGLSGEPSFSELLSNVIRAGLSSNR
jgi:hypothetical protein